MKRGASKRMMLLIAGVGAILLLVTLGYMLANHREGTTSQTGPAAAPPDPKIQLLIEDLVVLYPILVKQQKNSNGIYTRAGGKGAPCLPLIADGPKLQGKKLNYAYTGLDVCDIINPIKYKGQGIATSKTGEKITLTKQILTQALNQALVKLKPNPNLNPNPNPR